MLYIDGTLRFANIAKNRGCPSHFPDNELMKVMEWVWGVVAVTYYIGNLM